MEYFCGGNNLATFAFFIPNSMYNVFNNFLGGVRSAMGLFTWMITGHFVGDFLLQTHWMAHNKTKNIVALAVHSGVYTTSIGLLSLISGGLRWYVLLILFISHILLDQRSFVLWWCKHITKSADIPYLVMIADQSWHILILALACALTGG